MIFIQISLFFVGRSNNKLKHKVLFKLKSEVAQHIKKWCKDIAYSNYTSETFDQALSQMPLGVCKRLVRFKPNQTL
jgi:hypothetical protein